MTWHPEETQLQDHLEELLPPEEDEQVRSHLAECTACRQELEALADLRAGLATLPREAEPSRDLWPQVAWRMGQGSTSTPRREAVARRSGRRLVVPAWQLAAASLVVALLSGGSVWLILSGGQQNPPSIATTAPQTSAAAAGLFQPFQPYEEAVADLESVLEQGRQYLDEETVRVLEENLTIIDRAILEAQEALRMDPGSKILQRVLSGSLRKKVDLLRQAASVVYANS
jgi:hypothetical protein